MVATELRRKVRWLITIRALISTILLGSAIVAQITAPGSLPVDPLFFLIGLTFTLTIVYALTLRFIERHRWVVDLQLGGDALIVSAFILATGGVTSYFASLYVLPIVAGSTVQFRRVGLMVATLSAALYGGLVVGQYFAAAGIVSVSWFAEPTVVLPLRSVAQYTVGLNEFGFFPAGLLTGPLAENARTAGPQAPNDVTR